jgi:glyoxylase-like metal-dependent hydrolase (beta-lactamase superfamily II)
MKITQISEHVWSLNTWVLIPIHVWVVKEEDGVTLVDAGISIMAKGILKFIDSLNAGPLRRIVLTHGHSDHVGALRRVREAYPGVPVFAHRIEIPYMEGAQPYPGRKKAVMYLTKGVAQPLAELESSNGDKTGGGLAPIGALTPYFTPGHSPGHVVYYHEKDRVLLAGDLFNSKKGKLRKPMFTADMKEAIRSSAIVGELRPERLEVCHGSSVLRPADQLDEYVNS